jgi:ankyrin repeat protein
MNKRIGILCLSLLLSATVMIRAGNNGSTAGGSNQNAGAAHTQMCSCGRHHAPTENDPTFTALHKAASQGDFDAVVAYEGDVKDVNAVDSKGYSPLYYAAWKGHESIVDQLMQKGAQPIEGKNIVTTAVNNQKEAMAVSLLLRGFQPNENTARQAIRANYYSVLRRCMPPTAFDINAQDPQTGNTLLMESLQRSNCDKGMAPFLLKHGAHGDIADKDGYLPIHLAVKGGMLHTVKLLLAQNKGYAVAPLVVKNDSGGKTELSPLELYGTSHTPVDAIADELCKMGASAAQINLTTTLFNANPENADQVFNKLRTLGATDTPNDVGQTSLMAALARGYEQVTATLMAEQDSPQTADSEGTTLLHFAAWGGAQKTLLSKIITKYAISVNAVDKGGDTALHAAARQGKKDTVAALKALGAQELKNNKGEMPRDLALHASLSKSRNIIEMMFDDFEVAANATGNNANDDDDNNDDNDFDDNDAK